MIVCEKAMKKTSPIIITALQFAFASIFSFIAASLFEDISVVFHIDSSIYLQILYLAFFATTLCYLFQNVGQKFVNENIAALLLSLESVFGVFFSILLFPSGIYFSRTAPAVADGRICTADVFGMQAFISVP